MTNRITRLSLCAAALIGSGCFAIDAPESEAELEGMDAFIVRRMEQVRGRALPAEVAVTGQDRGEFREEVSDDGEEDAGMSDERRLELALSTLGLVPEDDESMEKLEKVMGEAIQGTYEPKTKTLRVVRDADGKTKDGTFAHEVVHAIDDGEFDLDALIELEDLEIDSFFTARCVVEGNATLFETDYDLMPMGLDSASPLMKLGLWVLSSSVQGGGHEDLLAGEGKEREEALKEAPPALIHMLVIPYIAGARFMNIVRKRGGVEAVDAVFRNPPTSSEQIFLPEKYYGLRDEPIGIELGPLPDGLAHFEELGRGTLGYYMTRLALGEKAGRAWKSANSDIGWEGDRIVLLRAGERTALLWRTEWDRRFRARQFSERLSEMLAALRKSEASTDQAEVVIPRGEGRGSDHVRTDELGVLVGLGLEVDEWSQAKAWLGAAKLDVPEGKRVETGFLGTAADLGSLIVDADGHWDGSKRVALAKGLATSLEARHGGFDWNVVGGGLLHLETTPDRLVFGTLFDLVNFRRNLRSGNGSFTFAGLMGSSWTRDYLGLNAALSLLNFSFSQSVEETSTTARIWPAFSILRERLTEFETDGTAVGGALTSSDFDLALSLVDYDYRAPDGQWNRSSFELGGGLIFGSEQSPGQSSWWTPLIGHDTAGEESNFTLFWGRLDL